MDKNRFMCVVALVTLTIATGNSKTTLFLCAEDVCNLYGKPQFCSDNDRCIDCDVKEDLCGTWMMPKNCSEYCCDHQRTNFIAQTCTPPWNIAHGHIKGLRTEYGRVMPGENVTFACDEGYSLIGNETFLCSYQGLWVPQSQTPTCTPITVPSETDWCKTAFIVICIVLFVSVLMNCVSLFLHLRQTNANEEQPFLQSRTPSENSFEQTREEQNAPFINDRQNQKKPTMGNGVIRDKLHTLGEFGDRMNKTNKPATDFENTDVKTLAEGYCRGELAELPDKKKSDTTHNNQTYKYPIQVQSADEHKMDHVYVREESEEDNTKKLALERGTVDHSDMGNGAVMF